jgi:hypothetical protein
VKGDNYKKEIIISATQIENTRISTLLCFDRIHTLWNVMLGSRHFAGL